MKFFLTLVDWYHKIEAFTVSVIAALGTARVLYLFFFKKKPTMGAATFNLQGDIMSTQTVPVTINVPKESKEVVDCGAQIISDVRAKKSIAEIAAGALPKIVVAVEGFDLLDDDAKSAQKSDLAAYLVKTFMDALGV